MGIFFLTFLFLLFAIAIIIYYKAISSVYAEYKESTNKVDHTQ